MPERTLIARELAEILSALGHPCRVRIIEELGQCSMDVNELVKLLGLSQPTISQHLGLLRLHRLVKTKREGRHVIYSLAQPWLAAWVLDGLRLIEADKMASAKLLQASAKVRRLWASKSLQEDKSKHEEN